MENKVIAKEYVDKNYIHKDLIKNKIKELTEKIQDYEKAQLECVLINNEKYYKAYANGIESCYTKKSVLEELLEDK